MSKIQILIMVFLILPFCHSCATAPKSLKRQDPLIGKIVDAESGRIIDFKPLAERLGAHDIIYLSEKHDNPDHHAAQHRIILELIDQGKPPVVGFEFFAMEQTPHLLNFMDARKADHSNKMDAVIEKDLRRKLNWESQPDRMWDFYLDLLKLCRDKSLFMAGLDLPQAAKRRITRKGKNELTRLEQAQLFSTGLDHPAYQDRMESIFKAVHCGMGHGKMTQRLYDTWVARNDQMALSITRLHEQAHKKGPVVVIVGNGHTEYGLGVMDRVRALDPVLKQVNLALTEITREPSGLDHYLSPLDLEGFEPVPPADFIWFTQRVSYQDPCQEFRKTLEKMKARKKN